MTRRIMLIAVSALLLAALIAACGSGSSGDQPGFIHVELGATETQAAQTQIALAHPSATPGPSPTPTMTSTPYFIPTDAPDYDGSLVITRVGSAEITLDQYRHRVRFERYRLLFPVAKLAEKYGTRELFDLTRPENAYISSLLATLADSFSFGAQVQRILVIEQIAFQEGVRRGLELDRTQQNALMAEWLGVQLGADGALTPEYTARYNEFMAGIRTYAGMSEEDLLRLLRAQVFYRQLEPIIGQEVDLDITSPASVGVQMQDIVVPSQAEAEAIAGRLAAGEALSAIASSLGLQSTSGETSRVLRRGDAALPEELLTIIFASSEGEIIGPAYIGEGWYVGKVGAPVVDMLQPADIEALRADYFRQWIEGRMDDPTYVVDLHNWIEKTPQEPLPRDVSPLMRDEYFVLPEGVSDPFGLELTPAATPQATPTGS